MRERRIEIASNNRKVDLNHLINTIRLLVFRFILFYRITYDPFCSIKMKITTFDRLVLMFV